ncbi:AEC family transporter [Providencia manganoxydans]|uniref:AEC family transporter n=1 Tax=Providencia manganoxydans TaxID=2923283 RepID=UPI0034E3EF87
MLEIIISALLPIVVTLALGYFAAWHKDFNSDQSTILNRLVMLYALPLTLFSGMLGVKRSVLLEQSDMALVLFISMVGAYIVVFVVSHSVFRRSKPIAALQALAVAAPSGPFIGIPVLGFLYGELSSIPVSLCGIIINLILVPFTLFSLSTYSSNKDGGNSKVSIVSNLKNTLKEPIIWMPVLAFIILILDFEIPENILKSLKLLGTTTGGIALFSTGIILYSQKVTFNLTILTSVITKNIIVPVITLGICLLMAIKGTVADLSIMTIALPAATISVILAMQYKIAEQEMASTFFFSTVLSIATMAAFLVYLH